MAVLDVVGIAVTAGMMLVLINLAENARSQRS